MVFYRDYLEGDSRLHIGGDRLYNELTDVTQYAYGIRFRPVALMKCPSRAVRPFGNYEGRSVPDWVAGQYGFYTGGLLDSK